MRDDVLARLRDDGLDPALKAEGYPRIGSLLWRIPWVSPQFVVTGSVAMLLQGIALNPHDVDIYVSQRLYRRLKVSGWSERYPTPGDPALLQAHFAGTCVHVWQEWDRRHTVTDVVGFTFDNLVWAHGWPCISLRALRFLKAESHKLNPDSGRHQKHLYHVRMIDNHLGEAA